MSTWHLGVGMVAWGCGAGAPVTASQEAHRGSPVTEPARVTTAQPAASSPPPPAAATGTDEVCHGSIDESLQHQLAERAAEVRVCYEYLLRRDPAREGRLMITVKLSGAGTIDRAWTTLDELADSDTTDCALASFKEPLNGSVTGGCAIVNVPLRFKLKKAEPQPPP